MVREIGEGAMEGEMVGIRWMDQGEMEGAMDQGASAGSGRNGRSDNYILFIIISKNDAIKK